MSATQTPTAAYSAQGTRLNKRGVDTRRRVLDTAVQLLAEGNHDALSANLVARESGVTWGTIQHQFGDADGVWAAVLDHVNTRAETLLGTTRTNTTLRRRVADIVHTLWDAYDSDDAKAVQNLRRLLPLDQKVLAAEYPATASRLRGFDEAWAERWGTLFTGIPASAGKVRRLSTMLPGAVRGLHDQSLMASYSNDLDVALDCLIDSVAAYLSQ